MSKRNFEVCLLVDGDTPNLAEQADDRSRYRSHNKQQHHHGHGTVLILVVKGRSEKTIGGAPLQSCWLPQTEEGLVVECAHPCDLTSHDGSETDESRPRIKPTPQASFTDANLFPAWTDTFGVQGEVISLLKGVRAATLGPSRCGRDQQWKACAMGFGRNADPARFSTLPAPLTG